MSAIRSYYLFTFLTYLIILLTNTTVWAANIGVQVDSKKITEGQSFQVVFTVTNDLNDAAPDFLPLEKDFIILGSHQSVQMQFINGKALSTKQWTVILVPKILGKLKIPPIQIGNEQSREVAIEILSRGALATDGQTQDLPNVFIEAEIDQADPYVQSEAIYTLRLYSAVRIMNGSLVGPRSDDALVITLGEETHDQEERNGQLYRVIERRFSIFPQRSGLVEISEPVFTGVQQEDIYARFNRWSTDFGSVVRLFGPIITLDVKPAPAAVEDWLPARLLTLRDQWPKATIRVGEPITRTIVIEAQGLTAAQLPEITVSDIAGVNAYADKAQIENKLEEGQLYAQRTEKIAYIPTKAGEINIPAITIPWWNTKTNRAEVAELPAVHLQVLPSEGEIEQQSSQAPMAEISVEDKPLTTDPMLIDTDKETIVIDDLIKKVKANGLMWGLVALFFSAWIITLLLWWQTSRVRRRPVKKQRREEYKGHKRSLHEARANLKSACKNNEIQQAKEFLITWAALRWPQKAPKNLTELTALLPQSELAQELNIMVQILYSSHPHPWDGHAFWQVFIKVAKIKVVKPANENSDLPPLHLT
ncbi:MAG: BatD family protein [Gammaproteobacteria bacterium]